MPIAYFHQSANKEFWSDHWQKQDVGSLVAQAERSYLLELITANLPPTGRILEAGCGLGQYVIVLRRLGYEIEGIDFSEAGIRACRDFDPAGPVRAGDVTQTGAAAGYYRGYISLGVVEHFQEGPAAVLREANRILSADGVLLLSVPFANRWRRLFSRYIRREQAIAGKSGADFYQYAFTKKEIRRFLADNGFQALEFFPYDPGRLPKAALRRLLKRRVAPPAAAGNGPIEKGKANDRRSTLARRLLYSSTWMGLFAHMILVTAKKA